MCDKKYTQDEFEQIFELKRDYLKRRALYILGNVNDADDAVQEAYIRVWQRLDSLVNRGLSLLNFAVHCVKTASLNIIRSRSRALKTQMEAEKYLLCGGQISRMPDALPEDALLRQELKEALTSAISKLPEACREAYTLYEIENKTYEEISTLLNKPIGTVKSRINYARNSLKTLLAKDCDISAQDCR